MKCPNCNAELKAIDRRGIQIDWCQSCKGMWLDLDELDQLEDQVFDIDKLKGSVVFGSRPSNRVCPHCSQPLRFFQYRAYDLELEFCERHGYWLDEDEENRVLKIMAETEGELERKFSAEDEWRDTLRKIRSRSFIDRIRKLLE